MYEIMQEKKLCQSEVRTGKKMYTGDIHKTGFHFVWRFMLYIYPCDISYILRKISTEHEQCLGTFFSLLSSVQLSQDSLVSKKQSSFINNSLLLHSTSFTPPPSLLCSDCLAHQLCDSSFHSY